MICTALQSIGLRYEALVCGSKMDDFLYVEITGTTAYNNGKDESINHMLAGGNGFPQSSWSVMQAPFDNGCTIERRDLRSLTAWSRDLNQCIADRKRGRVE